MKKNNQTRAEIVFDEINEVENMLSEQPKESTHITWWKGLNEEEQTAICEKYYYVGMPLTALKNTSIEAMYHYENAAQPVISEVMKIHNLTMLAAMEFGYRECEKGNNLDMAFINFNKALQNK